MQKSYGQFCHDNPLVSIIPTLLGDINDILIYVWTTGNVVSWNPVLNGNCTLYLGPNQYHNNNITIQDHKSATYNRTSWIQISYSKWRNTLMVPIKESCLFIKWIDSFWTSSTTADTLLQSLWCGIQESRRMDCLFCKPDPSRMSTFLFDLSQTIQFNNSQSANKNILWHMIYGNNGIVCWKSSWKRL